MPDQPKATLESIAEACGVSRQTVSNVINAPEKVKPSTRRKVEKAIAKVGYRPSAAARALRRRRAETVALRMFPASDGINAAVLDRFLHELVTAAQAVDHRVLLFTAGSAEAEVAAITDLVHRGVVDGCVLTDTIAHDIRPGALQAAGVPFVAFGRPWEATGATHAWVDIDGAAGTSAATRALLEAGRGPVGWIGWPDTSGVGADRRAGWLDAVGPDAPHLEEAREDGIAEGREAMAALLDRGVRSVVCASDSLAVGAVLAWHDRHGEDATPELSPVVGFDDTPLARFRSFSSVAQPVEDAARACIKLLLAQLEGSGATPDGEQVLLAPTVILRAADGSDTTALPRQHH